MNKNYEFIYSLVYQDKVFYIGRCKDLLKRYRWHLHAKGMAKSAQYIRWIISQGHFPDINVIDWIPQQDAIKREAQIILDFSTAGHLLMNYTFARSPLYDIKKRPDKPSKKEMYKIAKYKQLNCMNLFIHRHKYATGEQLDSPKFIPNPFQSK